MQLLSFVSVLKSVNTEMLFHELLFANFSTKLVFCEGRMSWSKAVFRQEIM